MSRLVLLGWPARHSLSPSMHGAALRSLGLPFEYVSLDVPPGRLSEVVASLRDEGFLGGNVTVPHKRAVVPLCDEVDDLAARIGAVNTLVHGDGRLRGANTDVEGFRRCLMEEGIASRGARIVVLGSGGAARAVVAAAESGGASVTVVARDPSRASWARPVPWTPEVLAEALANAALLVNASVAGMNGAVPPCDVPVEALPRDAAVFDLVYRPLVTPLLDRARARGLRTIDGLRMLLYQGAASFRLWTGKEPPVRVMERALGESLG